MNKYYKIAFLGVGSIGKRHLLNVADYLRNRDDKFQIDVIRSGKGGEIDNSIKSNITEYYTYDDVIPNNYDVIFITNPTALHYSSIKRYITMTKNMFIEKPVVDRTDVDITNLCLNKNDIYYVACPLRYTNVLQYIEKNIDYKNAYAVRAICSSYLPEWRPNVDYRTTYSAHKDMGGGVSIDLIHEWDYLIHLFGNPKKVMNIKGTYSNLEIDSDDCSVYIATTGNTVIELHLDYFGRKNIRQVEMFFKDETIVGDFSNFEVRYLSNGRTVNLKEQRNDFQMHEIKHFFKIVDREIENDNNIITAFNTLKIARGEIL